jgi:hypothetical protein
MRSKISMQVNSRQLSRLFVGRYCVWADKYKILALDFFAQVRTEECYLKGAITATTYGRRRPHQGPENTKRER